MAETKRKRADAVFPVDPDAVLMERLYKVWEDETGTASVSVSRSRGRFAVEFDLVSGEVIEYGNITARWRDTLTKALEWWDQATGAKAN